MSPAAATTEDWDRAPCGLAVLRPDGTVLEINTTLLTWVGRRRDEVVGRTRLDELLTVGGRIYWETHLAPLLHVEGRADEVALELRTPSGRRPVVLIAQVDPSAGVVRVVLTGATVRSGFERELVAARAAAERSSARVRQLQGTTAALSSALGVLAVADALLAAAHGTLGAADATLWLVDADGRLTVHPTLPSEQDEPAPPTVGGLEGLAERDEQGRVVVPLHGQAAVHGVLRLTERADPGAEPLDLEVLTAVGQQAGLALDRAHRYEQSADVAHALQQSLLAVEPPLDARFSVATAYRPGTDLLEVGGDWYDTFLSGEGRLSFLVGDVVGRGLRAASAMGQLRSAVRAVAGPDVGPGRLLSRLDHFVEQVDAATMATVVYAELDLATGLLRYACAGHPPPLLLPAHGAPRLLWDGRSTPLGAFLHPRSRPEAELALEPGDRLLFYTDGLVERRERGIDAGLHLLVAEGARVHRLPLPEAVAALTSSLLEDEVVRDDVCVLLLTWEGVRFRSDLAADLGGLSALRRELGSWLAEQGVEEHTRDDLVLAASEAVANAAEHGCARRPEERVSITARLDRGHSDAGGGGGIDGDIGGGGGDVGGDGGEGGDGRSDEVVLVVRDPGRWRTSTPSVERGRGLLIMKMLVDDVSVDTAADGTTVVLRRRLGGGAL